MGKGDGLGSLQVGVTRHHRLQAVRRLVAQHLHKLEHQADNLPDLFSHVQPHIQGYLIVPGPGGVEPFSRVPDPLREQLLVGHVNVLVKLRAQSDLSLLHVL